MNEQRRTEDERSRSGDHRSYRGFRVVRFVCVPLRMKCSGETARTVVNWVGCALGGAPTPTTEAAIKGLQSFSLPGRMPRDRTARTFRCARRRCDQLPRLGGACVRRYPSRDHHASDGTGDLGAARACESQPLRGEDFLTALMIGMEIECRLSAIITAPGTGSSGGWYITGVTGSIGAAAAVGRVLGLDRTAMVSALGLAAAQSCGTRGTHASMACAYVPALAAQAGFVAAMMARAGFECGPAAVAGRNGVVEVIAPKADHAAITRDFGKHWEVLGNAYKPYPCGIVIHSAIDACLELVRKHKPNPGRHRGGRVRGDAGRACTVLAQAAGHGARSAGQSISLACGDTYPRRGDRDAGAACLHPGHARTRLAITDQRHIQPGARHRSGEGCDAHA